MMYINIYKDNPTQGMKDGNKISESILDKLILAESQRIRVSNPGIFYADLPIYIGTEYAVVDRVEQGWIYLVAPLTKSHLVAESVKNFASAGNPLTIKEANKPIKLAIRAKDGFICNLPVKVTPTADHELSHDGVTWDNQIAFYNVTDTNQIFYIRADSGNTAYLKIECKNIGGN